MTEVGVEIERDGRNCFTSEKFRGHILTVRRLPRNDDPIAPQRSVGAIDQSSVLEGRARVYIQHSTRGLGVCPKRAG